MEYVPIRVSTLRGDQKVSFDAYVKINEKFILYIRRGDSFEGERLARLRAKKLKKMFILPADETQYRGYLQRNIEGAYDKNSGKTIQNRGEIIQGNQQTNAEEVFENPDNAEAYHAAKTDAGKFVNFLMSEDAALQSIMAIENSDQNLGHHGVSVSTLAVGLAQKLGMMDPKQNQMLALGALLHDFGHTLADIDFTKPHKGMTPEEMKIYRTHPTTGARAVQDKKHFDQQVLNCIMQHEEHINGSGFPQGLREKQTDPLAVIVSSCNAVDRLISFEKVAKKDAIRLLTIEKVGCHPLTHIQHLNTILSTLK